MKVRERAVRNASLLAVLLLVCALVVPAVAFAQTQVLDVAAISKIADGTHDGNQGTATRLNTANGYQPGDDSIDDGVVASGDIVAYDINISIQAARQRELWLVFDDANAPYLTTELIKDFRFNSAMVPVEEYEDIAGKKVLHLTVRRGAAGLLKKTLTLPARDTAGVTQGGNYLVVDFYTKQPAVGVQPESTFITDPVTVISAPFADLTLDTNLDGPIRYNTNDLANGGQFVIMPQALHTEKYSRAGLIASSTWHTDINVSGLPAETIYKLCPTTVDSLNRVVARSAAIDRDDTGQCQTLTATDGVIKDVRASGPKTLWYKMPNAVAQTTASYTVSLDVKEDSFQVGDAKNVPDPGQGEPQDYDTSRYTVGEPPVSAGAKIGRNIANNNYSTALWEYHPPGEATSNLYAPSDTTKTIFESQNLQWQSASVDGYVKLPRRLIQKNPNSWFVTEETQMYDWLSMNVDLPIQDATKITITHQINTGTPDADKRDISYDLGRRVLVFPVVDGSDYRSSAPLAAEKYTVKWYDAQRELLGESKNPEPNAVRGEISFLDRNAFGSAQRFHVAWPVKSDTYATRTCSSSSDTVSSAINPCLWFENINTVTFAAGATDLPGNDVEDVEKTTTSNGYIVYPSKPDLTHNISGQIIAEDSVRHTVQWTVENILEKVPSSQGYHHVTTSFTLSKDQDPETFAVTAAGWECNRPDSANNPREFKCTYAGTTNLQMDTKDSGKLPALVFTTQTIPFLTISSTQTIVHSKVAILSSQVQWNKVAGLDEISTTGVLAEGVTDIATSNNLEAVMEALTPVEETATPITWRATMSVGALKQDGQWSQVIMLPKSNIGSDAGDVANWRTPICTEITRGEKCQAVDTRVNIGADGYDTTGNYDGFGESMFNGTYTIGSFKINSYVGTDTALKLIYIDNEIQKEVNITDAIESGRDYGQQIQDKISGLPISAPDIVGLALEGKGTNLGSAGDNEPVSATGAVVDITLNPDGNKPDDKYLLWLGPTWKRSGDTNEANSTNSWPDLIVTRLSTLSGVAYEDKNSSASLDLGDQNRYAGLKVQLKCDISQDFCKKTWDEYNTDSAVASGEVTVNEVKTGEHGEYSFDKVHEGSYQVVLPELRRENTASSEITTDYLGLKATENRFKMPVRAIQTESFGKTWLQSNTQVQVQVPRAGAVTDVNFGFIRPEEDLALNKSLPTYNPTTGAVNWDITIKNTGNTPISDVSLFDRTESKVTSVSVAGTKKGVIAGTGAVTAGNNPGTNGLLVATTDGAWLYKGGRATSYQRIVGISGTPIYALGDKPADRSIVNTSTGWWYVNGQTGQATLLSGITGKIVNEKPPAFVNKPALIGTTDGVWIVKTDGTMQQVSGLNGKGEITSVDSSDVNAETREITSGTSDTDRKEILKQRLITYYGYVVAGKKIYKVNLRTDTADFGAASLADFGNSGQENFSDYQNNVLRVSIGTSSSASGWSMLAITDMLDVGMRANSALSDAQKQAYDNQLCAKYAGPITAKCAKVWRTTGDGAKLNGADAAVIGTNTVYEASMQARDVIMYRDLSKIVLGKHESYSQGDPKVIGTDLGYWTITEGSGSTGSGTKYYGYVVPGSFALRENEAIRSVVRQSGNTSIIQTNRRVIVVYRGTNKYEYDLSNKVKSNVSYTIDSSKHLSVTRTSSSGTGSISGTPLRVFGSSGSTSYVLTTTGFYKVNSGETGVTVTDVGLPAGAIAFYASSGIPGQVQDTISSADISPVLYTSAGLTKYTANGTSLGQSEIPPLDESLVLTLQGQKTEVLNESSGQKKEYATREYKFSNPIEAGATVVVQVKGTVLASTDDQVVANQAWLTSPRTPRQNLFTGADSDIAPKLPETVEYGSTSLVQRDPSSSNWKAGNVQQVPSSRIALNYLAANGDIIDGATTVSDKPDQEYLAAANPAADDLADMTYLGIAKNPSLVPKYLAGKAWYDANSNGLEDADENPVSGLTVNIYDVAGADAPLASTTTSADGTWSATVPEDQNTQGQYYVTYAELPHQANNQTWIPTTSNISPTNGERNSDSDSAGFAGYKVQDNTVSGVTAAENENNAKLAHNLDLGIRPINVGLVIKKGLQDSSSAPDTVNIVDAAGTVLPDQTSEIRNDAITLTDATMVMPASSNRIVQTPTDNTKPAFLFEIDYNPSDRDLNLVNLRLADETIQGEKAVLQKTVLKCTAASASTENPVSSEAEITIGSMCGGSLETVNLVRDTAGSFKLVKEGSQEQVQLAAGDKLFGAYVVPITSGNKVHEDKITVTASSADKNDPTITQTDLTDTDAFKVTYQQAPSTVSLEITKVDQEQATRLLRGAKFKISKYTGSGEPSSDNTSLVDVGTVTTGNNGKITASNLTPGYYQLEETAAPWGYRPVGHKWWIKLGIDSTSYAAQITCVAASTGECASEMTSWSDGSASVSTVTTAESPTAQMVIKNERLVWILPHTGGPGILGLIACGLALISLSGWMYLRRYRRTS